MAWDQCGPSPTARVFKRYQHWRANIVWEGSSWKLKELTELADGSDYDVNASGYYRLPADSYADINMGEPEETPVMNAVNLFGER